MSSETTSPSLSPEAALVLLELPDVEDLSADQRRGAVCVWTGRPLTNETAIDLGERTADDGMLWFPRATREGVRRKALSTLHLHSQACEQCMDDYRSCPEGYPLVRLVREFRQ